MHVALKHILANLWIEKAIGLYQTVGHMFCRQHFWQLEPVARLNLNGKAIYPLPATDRIIKRYNKRNPYL